MKLYTSEVPDALHEKLQDIADKNGITITELMQRFIKLELIVDAISERDDVAIIVRQDGEERHLVL